MKNVVCFGNMVILFGLQKNFKIHWNVGLNNKQIQYASDGLGYIGTVYYDLCGKSGIIPGLTTFRFLAQ